MFDTLRKRRIADYTEKAAIYVKRKYVPAPPPEKPAIVTPPKTGSDSGVRHSRKTIKGDNRPTIKYTLLRLKLDKHDSFFKNIKDSAERSTVNTAKDMIVMQFNDIMITCKSYRQSD